MKPEPPIELCRINARAKRAAAADYLAQVDRATKGHQAALAEAEQWEAAIAVLEAAGMGGGG